MLMNAHCQKNIHVKVFVKIRLEVIHVAVHLERMVIADSFVKEIIRVVLLPFSKVSYLAMLYFPSFPLNL